MENLAQVIMTTDSAEDEPIRVGAQLRHARLVKNLKLKQVAELSGFSESMISKIENNKATPSLNTLHKIARTLDTSVAALLEHQTGGGNVAMKPNERPRLSDVSVAGQRSDGTEAEVMIHFGASQMLEAFIIRVKPGGSSNGLRQHDGEEVGYVTAGSLELTVDGAVHTLEKGDSFFFASTLPHGFRNIGDTDAEIVWVNTPPSL